MAQSPLTVGNVGSSDASGFRITQALGPANPWIKWAVSGEAHIKSFTGGAFGEQWLLAASKLTYEVPMGTSPVHIPVMANLASIQSALGSGTKDDSLNAAISALTSSTDGLNVGVYPYWFLGSLGKALKPNFFLGASAKINSFKDTVAKTDETLLTGRFSAGLEFLVGDMPLGSDDKPLTISFTGVRSQFGSDTYRKITGTARSHIYSAELTSVLPISTNAGILFEAVTTQYAKPSFRIGMMVAATKTTTPNGTNAGDSHNAQGCPATGCAVIVDGSALDNGVSVTVTDATKHAHPKRPKDGDPFACDLTTNTSCTFIIPKNQKVTLTAPAGFTIGGDICVQDGGCSIDVGKAGTVKVTKSGT
jgi:hypothetical protein